MAVFGEIFENALGGGLGGALGGGIVGALIPSSTKTSQEQTTRRIFDQQAIDKLIYDIMSSDQGLAALATSENASGGYKSSGKTLLAQDLIAKVAGEIATITAPTETKSSSKTKKGTVICTALMINGYLDKELYAAGTKYYHQLNPRVLAGYHRWAFYVVELQTKCQWLNKILTPIAISRYETITKRRFGILGALTVYVGEPLCWLISFLPSSKVGEKAYG